MSRQPRTRPAHIDAEGEIHSTSQALTVRQTALTVSPDQVQEIQDRVLKYGSVLGEHVDAQGAALVARLAIAYGLDPFAGELLLMGGKPYLSYAGAVRIAENHPAFDGIECEPATVEQREAFRCGADEELWVARVWRKDRRFPFVGYGRASKREDKQPVARTWTQEMAQKRAKHRAFRDAFALPLPGAEEQLYEGPARYDSDQVIDVVGREMLDEPQSPPATRGQVGMIHAKVKDLGWTDEEYRAALQESPFHVDTSKELSEGEASSVLEFLDAQLAEHSEDADVQFGREAYERGEDLTREASRAMIRGWTERFDEDQAQKRAEQDPTAEVYVFGRGRAEQRPVSSMQEAEQAALKAQPPITSEVMPSEGEITEYGAQLAHADFMGIDVAPYAIDARVTANQLAELREKLQQQIDAKAKQK